jgi:hypothetical protein
MQMMCCVSDRSIDNPVIFNLWIVRSIREKNGPAKQEEPTMSGLVLIVDDNRDNLYLLRVCSRTRF